jgi:hypothetical protein
MMALPWWGYVIMAGLAWGTYVPIIFFGGQMLSILNPAGIPQGIGGRLASILCVGVAYFVMAVVIPVALMTTLDGTKANWRTGGLIFSGLAGVAGAVGAICVIFASSSASSLATTEFNSREAQLKSALEASAPEAKAQAEQELKEFQAGKKQYIARYRVYIAPLIFCLAPLINTLLSLIWHPDHKTGEWAIFHFEMPGWKLPLGIILVAAGTYLVLASKEDVELNKGPGKAAQPPATSTAPATPS